MKRIAILIGLALLADVEPVLAQGARGGSHAASSGRSIAGYTGGSVAGYTGSSSPRHGGQPVANHRPGGHQGHGGHNGHHHGHQHRHGHHLHIGIGFPWWWHHHRTVVVTAPVYVPVYTPVPEPVHVGGSDLRYFCPDYRDYYPNVATCPSQWLQVVPQALTTSY